jgi:Putative motility protein
MDPISAASSTGGAPAVEGSEDLILLKKGQEMAKQESAQLLEAMPKPQRSPSPPGVGGRIDISA